MSDSTQHKVLNIALWIAQFLLAAAFAMAGYMKMSTPIDDLGQHMAWAKDIPEVMVRIIGFFEFVGAMGLLLPALVKIKTMLTPWAASGLIVVMLLAAGFHLIRGEFSAIGVNLGFAAVALFVAWGRFRKVKIEAKH